MDDVSSRGRQMKDRERQRNERDRRAQEREERQIQIEIEEQRRELERIRQSIDRDFRSASGRDAQHLLTIDQDREDLDYFGDTGADESLDPHEPVRRKISFKDTRSRDKAFRQTPSFLRGPDDSGFTSPNSILVKSSTPYHHHTDYRERDASFDDIQERRKEDRTPFEVLDDRTPFQRAFVEDADSLQEQAIQMTEVGYIEDMKEEIEEMQVMERIKALQLQADQMTQKSRQRIEEEKHLKEKMSIMEERRRKFAEKMERQNKIVFMRQEEEKMERLLEQRREEEKKQKHRLEILYKQEARMRTEMEKENKQLQYRLERETFPMRQMKQQIKREERETEQIGHSFLKPYPEPREPELMFEKENQRRSKEPSLALDIELQRQIEDDKQYGDDTEAQRIAKERQYISNREEELHWKERYLRIRSGTG